MATLVKRGIGAPDSIKYASGKPTVPSTIPYKKSTTLMDMAELAVRIGSPISMDRRGDVFFYDDFESGLSKVLKAVAGTGTLTMSSATARSGFLSAKIFVPSTVANDKTVVIWGPPYVTNTKMGAEISFSSDSLQRTRKGRFNLVIEDQFVGGRWTAEVRIALSDNGQEIYYRASDGTYTLLDTYPIISGSLLNFHSLKLVCDLTTHKYERLIFKDTEWDLSALNMLLETGAALIGKTSGINATVYDYFLGSDITMYIDDLILTINEPPNE